MRCYRVRFTDTSGGRHYVIAHGDSRWNCVRNAYQQLDRLDVMYPAKPHTTRLKMREPAWKPAA